MINQTVSTSSLSSSSSRINDDDDDGEWESDGFPPVSKNNKFVSIKSCGESLPERPQFQSMTSINIDGLSEELLLLCKRIIMDPQSVTGDEKQRVLDTLEHEIYHRNDLETSINDRTNLSLLSDSIPNFTSIIPPTSITANENQSVSPAPAQQPIKIEVTIPTANNNPLSLKYKMIRPTYNRETKLWHTGLEFIQIINNDDNKNDNIQANTKNNNDSADNNNSNNNNLEKDFGVTRDSIGKSFVLLKKPIGMDTRIKSQERLLFPEVFNFDPLDPRFSSEIDISYLEKLESRVNDSDNEEQETSNNLSNAQNSFRLYKTAVQNTIGKQKRNLDQIKRESEKIFHENYESITEKQFKRHSRNQILLKDTEQELNNLSRQINRKDVNIEKIISQSSSSIASAGILRDDIVKDFEIQNEISKNNFAQSIRLINQMITILKGQVEELKNDFKSSLV